MNRMVVKPTTETQPSIGMTEIKGEIYYLHPSMIRLYKNQARKDISEESIIDLADSINSNGIIQPLQVIPSLEHKGEFEVVSGERRLRAAIKLGLDKVPCMVLDREKNADEIALIENIQREDLHPIELAEAISSLLKGREHGSQAELATRIGISKQQMSHLVAISRMPADVKSRLLQIRDIRINLLKSLAYISDENELRSKVFKASQSSQKFKSILRMSFNGHDFKVENLKINKLSKQHKQDLFLKVV